jgi:hypothetical protein
LAAPFLAKRPRTSAPRLASLMLKSPVMSGLVTERDFKEAEAAFPGIERFYQRLSEKPRTFLDLLRLFLDSPQKQ